MVEKRSQTLQTVTLNSASFIAQFAISMVNFSLIYHLRAMFSLSAQMIGIAASTYTLSYFFFCIMLEQPCSHIRPRHCVEVSMIGMSLSIIWIIWSRQIWQVFFALILYGLFMAMLWPQVMGWLSRGKEGERLNRATSSFNFSWSFGAGLSPLLAGFLVEKSTEIPMMVGTVLLLFTFLLIVMATYLVPSIRATTSEASNRMTEQKEDSSTPLRFLCWAGVLTVYIALSVMQTIFPLHALDSLKIPERMVGLLMLIRGLATSLVFVYTGSVSWWQFKRSIALAVQILVAIVFIIGSLFVVSTPYWAYAILFLLFGTLLSFAYTLSIFHGASGSVRRAKRMMIHEILLTTGSIIGATFGGTIYQHFGFTKVMWWCGLLVLIPVAVSLAGTPTRKQKPVIDVKS
ncbi:MAG: MFS transporter [Spirochaetales bacterium]|jgi:DHA1 family multidrug resistance protein-like MFS transporter/DHA1 family quinolone resistance protein-like MFS transporter|nr:MFS transporter [Spirochaetales bacterium]